MPFKPFDRDCAKAFQLRSVEARRRNALQRKQLLRQVSKLAKQNEGNGYALAQATTDQPERLEVVREQLATIDCRIREELNKTGQLSDDGKSRLFCDGQQLNWLVQAQSKLAEQERQLSGRPLPGTLRPTAKQSRSVNHQQSAEPLDE